MSKLDGVLVAASQRYRFLSFYSQHPFQCNLVWHIGFSPPLSIKENKKDKDKEEQDR